MKQEELKQLRQLWAERVAEFEASGQNTTEWCSEHGIKTAQLRYWLRKYRHQENANNKAATPQWQALEVDNRTSNEGSELKIRVGSAVIEVKPGFDKKLLRELIDALSGPC